MQEGILTSLKWQKVHCVTTALTWKILESTLSAEFLCTLSWPLTLLIHACNVGFFVN